MLTNHVDQVIDAYLDQRLAPDTKLQVETHIKICPSCASLFYQAQRLDRDLREVMQSTLGQPLPPAILRQRVHNALAEKQDTRPFFIQWSAPAQILNAVGTAAIIAALAFGAFAVVRGQLPGAQLVSGITTLGPYQDGGGPVVATPTPTAIGAAQGTQTPGFVRSSLGDTLPSATSPTGAAPANSLAIPPAPDLNPNGAGETTIFKPLTTEEQAPSRSLPLPGGTIAFALFDHNPAAEIYKIHLINPDGHNQRTYPLDGVSEPALYPGHNDFDLALRAWGTGHARTLMTSDVAASRPESITHFWEDAQPDWSPTENRIIFASQRESDRRWRLYSAWGDGSLEVNLRREGKSPTFAPDGDRFAFESCDITGQRCGLWVDNLDNTEFEGEPFLEDPLAKSPDWSPNTEEIAFMANPGDNWDLYVVNSDGSNLRRLTEHPANDGLPAWSPDGAWLAFVSNRGGDWGLWLLHVESGKQQRVVTFEENHSLTPPDRLPYSQHGERFWWDEQISWGP